MKRSARQRPHTTSKSEQMARVRRSGTAPELILRRALWRAGLRYRVNRKVDGARPDIVFLGPRVAVFVDGCFWHGCPKHGTIPNTNTVFWTQKIAANKERDVRDIIRLNESGWKVLRYWEHDLTDRLEEVIRDVLATVRGEG